MENTISRKQIGRLGLSMAINYFTACGYTVSLPINDTQWYDLIVEKDNIFYTIQCKATATDDSSIQFRSTGGTKGRVYDNILNHPKLDYLFCVNKDMKMWLIPLEALKENKNSIRLKTTPNSNNQGIQTYKYQIKMPKNM